MNQEEASEIENGIEYHRDMLIARFRPEAVEGAKTVRASGPLPEAAPGLSALEQLDQQGLVRQVTPIGSTGLDATPDTAGMVVSAIVNSQPHPANGDPTAGVNLIRLGVTADVDDLQERLEADPTVAYVARVPVRYLAPANIEGQGAAAVPRWNLERIQWEGAKAVPGFKDAVDIRVAILDTGVQSDHPNLEGRITRYTYGHLHLPTPARGEDIVGHGTHVAGILGAVSDEGTGVDGVSGAQLLVWKIFNDAAYRRVLTDAEGRGWFAPLVDPLLYYSALADCIREDIHVINLSIGGPMPPDEVEQQLYDRLLAKGTTIVAAMGNERSLGSPVNYPAAVKGVLAVGATDPEDGVATFSNGGEHHALCAPGVSVWSTVPTYPGQGYVVVDKDGKTIHRRERKTGFAAWDGTSMATPHVSAAAALALANHGMMSGTAVRELLTRQAERVEGMDGRDWHPDYGVGRLNLLQMLLG